MVVPNNTNYGGEPLREKTSAMEPQQRYIRNVSSAPKETIGIPRAASHNIVRELKELDKAVNSTRRLDDDSTRSMTDSQRDKMDNHLPDTHSRDRRLGRSDGSKKSHRKRGLSFEKAIKKAILHSAKSESTSISNSAACLSVDSILKDLDQVISIIQSETSPSRSFSSKSRKSGSIQHRTKKEGHSSKPLFLPQNSKSLQEDSKYSTFEGRNYPIPFPPASYVAESTTSSSRQTTEENVVDPLKTNVQFPLNPRSKDNMGKSPDDDDDDDEWNPFEVNSFIASWPSESHFQKSPFFGADFENEYIISSKVSI